ncbi:hypothetical protein EZS27_032617, partial [termite gut metagenome]
MANIIPFLIDYYIFVKTGDMVSEKQIREL